MKFTMFCAALALAASTAQGPSGASGAKTATKHLDVTTSAADQAVGPGGRVSLFVDVAPKPKMHVYAPGQKDYIPISLTLEANPAVKLSPPRFPKSEQYLMPALGETQLVYSKPFRIVQDLTVARGTSREPLTLKGTLRYQACDDVLCYPPVNVPLTWLVGVR